MCTDCNEITIPQGPTGATGATGPAGADGAPGFAGINGTDGTTILSTYNSLIGVGTPNGLTETTLFTYNVPSNTLNTNGDELELYSNFLYTDNDTVTIRFKFGSKILTYTIQTAYGVILSFKIKIARISSTSQLITIERIDYINSVTPLGIITLLTDSSTVDLATILAFEISAQNSALGSNQVILKKATLYKYSA